jgi:hypothetical protein
MMSGAAATCEGEKLFMAKFNLWPSDTSSGEAPTTGSSTALGPAAVPEEAPAPAESMSRAASAAGLRFKYQSLSKATNNFEKRRRVWVSLSRSAGGGDACCCKKARARRFARRRCRVPVYCRSDAYRGGGAVASPPRQHRAADGMEQGRHGALLGLRLDGGRRLAGPSGVQRQRCLVPLTSNERILVLSDVAWGLAYLHSEVRVIHRDVKSANVLLDRGCHGRVGDFGIARSLNDNHSGITAAHMKTENVMGTQVYMAPEYKNGKLSMKVDSFAFGFVIIETLTGLPVLNPAAYHCNLLEMFEEDLDNPTKLLAHLDKRACWDQHKQERIGRLHSIAERCLRRVARAAPSLWSSCLS